MTPQRRATSAVAVLLVCGAVLALGWVSAAAYAVVRLLAWWWS